MFGVTECSVITNLFGRLLETSQLMPMLPELQQGLSVQDENKIRSSFMLEMKSDIVHHFVAGVDFITL